MPTRHYNARLQVDGTYVGEKVIGGNEIHNAWNKFDMHNTNISDWGLNANGFLQYKDTNNNYAGRFNPNDLTLTDYYFETRMRPAGTGNYEIGVFFRYKNDKNMYYFVYNGGANDWGGKNLRLGKVVNGTHIVLKDMVYPAFNTGNTYQVRVVVTGNNIKVYLSNTLIFDYNDTISPILAGAYGPFVKGQEFAYWENFTGISTTPFVLTRDLLDQQVDIEYFDVASALKFHPSTIDQLLQVQIQGFLGSIVYNSYSIHAYRASTSDNRVKLIFDKVDGKNLTTDPNSYLYVYQILPSSPPMTPVGLQGKAISHTQIKYEWIYSSDANDGFLFIDELGNVVTTFGYEQREFIENGLNEGTTYRRRIIAFNTAGQSAPSNEVIVTTFQTIPNQPLNFTGVAISDKAIKWRWQDTAFNENMFELIRWNGAGDIEVVATIAANVTEYIETGLTKLTDYTRAVRTKNTAGVSIESNTATVKTMNEIPNPPMYAPVNFIGVGISDDSILWTWFDYNEVVDGYEILDKDGLVLYRIEGQDVMSYIEDNLASSMEYMRYVRAYNLGGAGPVSILAKAKTLGLGQDYTGKPIAPMNLRADVLGPTQAQLSWTYEDHPLLPAVGFKLYNEVDEFITAFPVEVRDGLLNNLVPETTYRFYLTAFNDNGDSIKTNMVIFVTPSLEDSEQEEPVSPEELKDPYYGIEYDREYENMPPIKAIQSGIGDHLDLAVRNFYNQVAPIELFHYDLYVKALYKTIEDSYPVLAFRFQIICKGTNSETNEPYEQISNWMNGSVQYAGEEVNRAFKSSLSLNIPYQITNRTYEIRVVDADGNPILEHDPSNPNPKINWYIQQETNKEPLFIAWTKYKEPKETYHEWRSASVPIKEMRIEDNEELRFKDRIHSPMYDIVWQDLEKEYDFVPDSYKMVVSSSNPNVEVILQEQIIKFFPENEQDSMFIDVPLLARIINRTQTSWFPHIHNGYYYLNQKEHFLYAETKILPKDKSDRESKILRFPYVIKAYGERHYDGNNAFYFDQTGDDFLFGDITDRVTVLIDEGQVTLKEEDTEGSFISRIFDYGTPINGWENLEVVHNEQMIKEGAKLDVDVAIVDELGVPMYDGWYPQIIGLPISLPHAADRVRYRLRMKSAIKKELYNETTVFDLERISEGYLDKLEAIGNAIVIDKVAIDTEGTFISTPIEFGTHIQSEGFVEVRMLKPLNSRIELYSVSADTDTHSFQNPTADSPWVPLEFVSEINGVQRFKIKSAFKPWIAITAKLFRGEKTIEIDNSVFIEYQSPTLSDIKVIANLYQPVKVAPIVDSVRVGGYIPISSSIENHIVPMTGEVIANGLEYSITDEVVEDIVYNYLAATGVSNIDDITFRDYFVEADVRYAVELTTNQNGLGKVFAKTIGDVGEVFAREATIYFDKNDGSVILQPIPQSGTPLTIRNAQGRLLQQVHFRDSNGNPTLRNVEFLETDEDRYLFLQYRDIDLETLHVFMDLEKNENWTEIYNIEFVENRILLPHYFKPGVPVQVIYRVKDSFCVDYNYNTAKDYAFVQVHTTFDSAIDETRKLEVAYETSKTSPYYLATEVDVNPLRSKINSGFLYLTDQVYKPYRIEIQCNPNTLYIGKKERISINAFVLDEFGNPVIDEKVNFSVNTGVIDMINAVTGLNGMVTAIYEAPSETSETSVTIQVSVIRSGSDFLSKTLTLYFEQEQFIEEIAIVPQKRIVNNGDIVQLKVVAIGANNARISNKEITLTANDGIITPFHVITNADGEGFATYVHGSSPAPYIILTGTAFDENGREIKEQIILSKSGV